MAAQYPTAAGTDANLYVAANGLVTSLTDNPLTSGATTVNVASTTGFPTAGFITIDNEAIAYTGVTGTSFTTCTRGADGTTAASHTTATQVFHDVVAAHHNVLKDEIKAIETDLVAAYTGGSTSITTTFAKYLKLIGGTMSGAIAMGSNKITGLAAGSAAGDSLRFEQMKVVQYVVTTSGTDDTTTSSTFQATSLTGTITPTSASNKVLALAFGAIQNNSVNTTQAFYSIFRSTTELTSTGAGSHGVRLGASTTISNLKAAAAMAVLDSPATTSATVYTVKMASSDNVSTIHWGNGDWSALILIEVA